MNSTEQIMMRIRLTRSLLPAALLALAATSAAAQQGPFAMNTASAASRSADVRELSTALKRGGYAVVVDLDQNRLSFRQGDVVLWSAPIGTGTGLRLQKDEREWDFSTPNGVFHVQYKEKDPVWIAPDWYFIENGLPVPPANDKKRYFPGGLGAAAVYIGHDLAIHGTDKPELLGQRVSHGCIRLSNRDAERLFHNVQIGTEVIIVGGQEAARQPVKAGRKGNDPSTFSPAKPRPKPKDPVLERWKTLYTRDLLAEFSHELWRESGESRWTEVANLLVERAIEEGDDLALAGLLKGIADLPSGRVEREYRTFLADVYARGALRTLRVLSSLDREYRELAAHAIVAASIDLHGGDLKAPSTPWPTRRVPGASVGREERLGWNALARAEREYRSGD